MLTIVKFLSSIIILFFLCSCSSSHVEIGGVKYQKAQLSKLKCSENTRVISIGGTVFPEKRDIRIQINHYWVTPGTVTIGAKYYKQNAVVIQRNYYRPNKYRTSEEISKYTQYITHKFEPGKKYYIFMNKTKGTATPIINEIRNQ